RYKPVITLFTLLIICIPLFSQEVLDNNAPSVKWRQVNTPDFRVIFPEGFEVEAQRVANTLQTIHEPQKLGDKAPKKISIILRNRNAISNGFVTLGPRRSEFFTMPSQNNQFLGTNEWLDLLTVHEYRHIAQFQHSKTGFNKLFYYLFGENTQAGMAFTAVPPWFWEGDATLIETLNTPSGRGRIPEFSRVFKTNLLEKKKYNYNKQHLRSFKDFVPDHYRLGYHFVTHLRRRTDDPDIWDKVTQNAYGLPFVPFTFSNALKKHTDSYLVDNYNLMMEDFRQEWSSQLEGLEPTPFDKITRRGTDAFTDYSFPQVLEDGSIVAFKDGIGDVGQLVRLDKNGNEIEKFITGVMNNTAMLSSSGYTVVWNEYHFDPRWRAETFSVIKSYNFQTKELRTITSKSRYAGAAISPDGSKIVTTETTIDQQHSLIVVDAVTGNELKRFSNPDNVFYSMPRWSENGNDIVVLTTDDSGRGVLKVNYASESQEQLLEAGNENIGYPVLHDSYVYYNSAYNGIDNIYALNVESGERFQVTRSTYGAYNPQISAGKLIYNEHTADGLDVVETVLNKDQWVTLSDVEDRGIKYYEPLIEQEGHGDILSKVPDEKYPVKKYSRLGHMLNIHSWGPFATTDINRAQIGIFSKDVLSTTAMDLGYTYDVEEETGFATAGLSYQGFYPIFDVDVSYGDRKEESGSLEYRWSETSVETAARIPLVFTNSKFFRQMEVSNGIGVRKISDFRNNIDQSGRLRPTTNPGRLITETDTVEVPLYVVDSDVLSNGDLVFNHFQWSYYSLMKTSKRDIRSRWGFSTNFEQLKTISGDFDGSLTAINASIFLPGIFKHHSVLLQTGTQWRKQTGDQDLYSFRNRIFRPRGYSYFTDKRFTTVRGNYSLPIWYPDIALGPILNVQRIKANLFLDYGVDQVEIFFNRQDNNNVFGTRPLQSTYTSFGAEVTFDINIMRFSPLIEVGARYVYNRATDFEPAGSQIEFIIGNISF
ncbi:hypothetical protein, partial [Fulvivirga aurantia]|uniref:hypothetical protein n=1 Tax=Fulvivirga aurantia TaxID=2529383 RepID=UPI001627EA52